MKSPNLTQEEGILTLYAYSQIGSEERFSDQHKAVQWLSEVLKHLDVHESSEIPEDREFRSPDGLAGRVRRFRWLDEGRRDDVPSLYQELWDEYDQDWEAVRNDAEEILRAHGVDSELIPDELEGDNPDWSQAIRYVTPSRSDFYTPVRDALEDQVERFVMRETVALSFAAEADGYSGDVVVEIAPGQEESFRTDWSGSDPSRFPARIRAAATALRDDRRFGWHRIRHEEGDLRIEPLR
jgi:hypothetical protein